MAMTTGRLAVTAGRLAQVRSSRTTIWWLTALAVDVAAGGWLYKESLGPPVVVREGSNRSAVLDCSYNLSDGDVLFHVKWFHLRSGPTQVYQWIFGHRPQALGQLKGGVNLSHRVSDDSNEVYCALEILRPTVSLSGLYECNATSAKANTSVRRRLIVYAAPALLALYFTESSGRVVNITCHIQGVYPEPRVLLYRGPNGHTMVPMERFRKYVSWRDGLFDITVSWPVEDHLLNNDTIFECVMNIPQTTYEERRKVAYFPGLRTSSSEGISVAVCTILLVVTILALEVQMRQ